MRHKDMDIDGDIDNDRYIDVDLEVQVQICRYDEIPQMPSLNFVVEVVKLAFMIWQLSNTDRDRVKQIVYWIENGK